MTGHRIEINLFDGHIKIVDPCPAGGLMARIGTRGIANPITWNLTNEIVSMIMCEFWEPMVMFLYGVRITSLMEVINNYE